MFPPVRKMQSGFTLFGVTEQLGIFTICEITLFSFFPYSFHLGKTIWNLPNTLNYNVLVGNLRYDSTTSGIYSHWKKFITHSSQGWGHQGGSAGRGSGGTVSRVLTVVSTGTNKWGGISRLRNWLVWGISGDSGEQGLSVVDWYLDLGWLGQVDSDPEDERRRWLRLKNE